MFIYLKRYVGSKNTDIFGWNTKNREYCDFILKIGGNGSTGELWIFQGIEQTEVFYDTIELTEEMRSMDGRLIECYPEAVDDTTNRWVFNRLRTDRKHPLGLNSITSI